MKLIRLGILIVVILTGITTSCNADDLFQEGRKAFSEKEYDNAINAFSEGIKQKPKNADNYFWRGNAYRAKKQFDAALNDYTEAISLNPQFAIAYCNRGSLYLDNGKSSDMAMNDFNQAIKINPEDDAAYYYRGYIYQLKRQFDLAIKDYNEAIRLKPQFPFSYNKRGEVYQLMGNYDAAISDFNEAIRLYPQNSKALFLRGYSYYSKHELAMAKSDFTEVIHLKPQDSTAYYQRGNVNLEQRHFEEAIYDYGEAIRISPRLKYAYYYRGYAFASLGKSKEAIDNFQTFLQHAQPSKFEDNFINAARQKIIDLGGNVLSIGTASPVADSSMKVSYQSGVVDVNRMVKESAKLQELQNRLNEQGKTLSDKLEADKDNLSLEDFRKEKEATYDKFMKVKKDLESQFDRNIKQALGKVVLNKNLTIVFYKNSGYEGIDITTEVINEIDESSESAVTKLSPQITGQYGIFDLIKLRRDSIRLKELYNQLKDNQVDENDVKELQIKIDNSVKRALEKVAIDKKLTIVDKQYVLYGGVDVTDEVINIFDNNSD